MTAVLPLRRALFSLGSLILAGAFLMDSMFATDARPVPEPGTVSPHAIVGAAVVAVSLIGRRNKK